MGNTIYKIGIEQVIEKFRLEILTMPEDKEVFICRSDLNRLGLILSGYDRYFDNERIQIMGMAEWSFLSEMTPDKRRAASELLCAQEIPLVVVTRELEPPEELLDAARRHGIPVLRTKEATSSFMAALIAYLNVELAPRITRHGVLVEVYGEGVLLLGESGAGKSETAVELIKRGHRLIADDAVEIKRVSDQTLVGTSPEVIRHFIEIRGIGVVDVRRLYGMGAVKLTEKIDLIIQLEEWDEKKAYDRFGLESPTYELLGIEVPALTIPIRAGRNLAVIVEIAAMNNRQKKMGYNAAQELSDRLTNSFAAGKE